MCAIAPSSVLCFSSDNWGGTPIEYWMSPAALLKCTPPPRIRSRDFAPDSSSMYNSMIAPLTLGPLALTGVLWYQVREEMNAACAFPLRA